VTARGVILTLDYPPGGGGIARLLGEWTADTNAMEWLVLTSTPGPSTARVRRTTAVHGVPDLVRAVRWLRGGDPRIVVAGHPYLAGPANVVAALTRSRSACIVFGRELLPTRRKHGLALRALRHSDRVISISDHSAALASALGVDERRIRVVRPRLVPPWLAATVPTRRAGEGLQLVALTRLVEGYKNFELLLRLCAVLHPRGVIGGLTIIGDGPRREALRRKAGELGLGDVVRLPGRVPDDEVLGLLARAHLGLFPSRASGAERGFEGYGLAVHELAAAGLPVLVGAAAGAMDAAVSPWSRLLDPDDLWAWVQATEDLFNDEPGRAELGAAALAWARSTRPHESAVALASALFDDAAIRERVA